MNVGAFPYPVPLAVPGPQALLAVNRPPHPSARKLFVNSVRQDETGDPGLTVSSQKVAPAALIIFALTTTFAAFDWLMSLEPSWIFVSKTSFGGSGKSIFCAGGGATAGTMPWVSVARPASSTSWPAAMRTAFSFWPYRNVWSPSANV